jgi:ribosomal protein S18 acetylase RimI-like enzyme/predicted GNAT family acetyltransferase
MHMYRYQWAREDNQDKMALALKPAYERSIAELADLFTDAFKGYIGGTITLDATSMLALICNTNVDLTQSRLLLNDDQPIGLALISRQGWTSRVAAMGIIPEAQEKGMGGWFMQQLIEDARVRSDRSMVLEAFEQNTRAVRLYQRAGFNIVRRLMGYSTESLPGVSQTDLVEIDIYDVAKVVMEYGVPDLPWQMSGTSIARWTPPTRAYKLDHAYAVISDPMQPTITLRTLIVPPLARRQGQATRLLEALAALYPQKQWSVAPICPEEYGVSFLEQRGFTRRALNQVQMEMLL